MKTTSYCAAAGCDHPNTDTTLCKDCAAKLIEQLAEIPWVMDQLRIAFTKQARLTKQGGGSKSTEIPLIINPAAGTTMNQLAQTLAQWQSRIADHTGTPVRYPNPVTAAAWMLTTITNKQTTTWVDAGHMLDDLTNERRHADKIIYGPPQKWFAGICSTQTGSHICDQNLYAESDKGVIVCPRCGATHDVANRRTLLLKYAEDVLATASEAARAIVVWSDYQRGENKLVKRIGMWAERGRIERRGHVVEGGKQRPTYRIGDILDLLAADEQKKASA